MIALVGFAVVIERYVRVVLQELYIEAHGYFPPLRLAVLARKTQTAFSICAWVSLWAVKLMLLLFYREIFWISKPFRTAWWLVLGFTVVTFWVPIAGVLTLCGKPNQMWDISKHPVCSECGHA